MHGEGWIRRRTFIATLGSAATWPLVARTQQSGRMRRIGVLHGLENDEFYRAWLSAFTQRLQDLGWTDGRNIRIDYRFTAQNPEANRLAAQELVSLAPDVIFVTTNPAVAAVLRETHSIPIVFALVSDAVGSGFVASLAHPGGNITGFHNFEPALAGKWLEIINEIAPGVRRVAFLHVPETAVHFAFLRVIESTAPSLGLIVTAAGVHDAGDIDAAIKAFAREPNSGLIVAPSPITTIQRQLITTLADRAALPTVYPFRYFLSNGGLVSYGIDQLEQARGGASYVDRILRGTNPSELPVQLPTKYELAINLKSARKLGLKISDSFLSRADEVIE